MENRDSSSEYWMYVTSLIFLVRQADSSEYAKEKGFSFRETSARTSENVQSLFDDLATQMYHQVGNRIERKTIRLGQKSPVAHNKLCCNI